VAWWSICAPSSTSAEVDHGASDGSWKGQGVSRGTLSPDELLRCFLLPLVCRDGLGGGSADHGWEQDMARQYYVETEHRTSETSDRLEAARIADEWKKRGYKVETVVVDVTDESVQLVDSAEATPVQVRAGASVAAPVDSSGAERAVPEGSAPTTTSH